jgi:hypothetical protein
MVGLTNVDNISDANKPVSSATTSCIELKNKLVQHLLWTGKWYITKAMVGLGNVDNMLTQIKPIECTISCIKLKKQT